MISIYSSRSPMSSGLCGWFLCVMRGRNKYFFAILWILGLMVASPGSDHSAMAGQSDTSDARSDALSLPGADSLSLPGLDGDRSVTSADRVRGQVVSRHQVVLSSEIAGRVISIPYREGDRFRKGDALVIFDCAQHVARRDEAAADLDQAEAVLKTREDLARHKSTSELELITAENDYRRAVAKLKLQETFVDDCRVVAPFNGSIIRRGVSQYQYVDASEPVLEILDQNRLEIEFLAPSSWVKKLSLGDVFSIHIDETRGTYQARVIRIVPSIDPVSQSIRIFAKPKNSKGLVPGMSGWAVFPGNDKPAKDTKS